MSASPPLKTELGQDELRRRTRKLGQRHRTVLLLVDGRRSRDEVVMLAGQAGVAAHHFDELVEMGMIEMPVVPEPAEPPPVDESPAPPPPPPPPQASTLPVMTDSVEPVVALPSSPLPVAAPPDLPRPVRDLRTMDRPQAEPPPAPALAPIPAPLSAPIPALPPPLVPPPVPPVAVDATAAPVSAPMPLSAAPATPAGAAGPAVRAARFKFAAPISLKRRLKPATVPPVLFTTIDPAMAAPEPAPAPVTTEATTDAIEEATLDEVRSLLISTLLVDGPVSGSMLALQVRRAQTRRELIRLTWQVERNLVQARVPRESQSRLMRARDLLGLGNTVVADDTEPGREHQD